MNGLNLTYTSSTYRKQLGSNGSSTSAPRNKNGRSDRHLTQRDLAEQQVVTQIVFLGVELQSDALDRPVASGLLTSKQAWQAKRASSARHRQELFWPPCKTADNTAIIRQRNMFALQLSSSQVS